MDKTERIDNEVTSLFGEVNIPAGDNFEIQLGARYIDYELDQVTKPRIIFHLGCYRYLQFKILL